MTVTELLLLRRIYELEASLPNRTYARDHSFESWLTYRRLGDSRQEEDRVSH